MGPSVRRTLRLGRTRRPPGTEVPSPSPSSDRAQRHCAAPLAMQQCGSAHPSSAHRIQTLSTHLQSAAAAGGRAESQVALCAAAAAGRLLDGLHPRIPDNHGDCVVAQPNLQSSAGVQRVHWSEVTPYIGHESSVIFPIGRQV